MAARSASEASTQLHAPAPSAHKIGFSFESIPMLLQAQQQQEQGRSTNTVIQAPAVNLELMIGSAVIVMVLLSR